MNNLLNWPTEVLVDIMFGWYKNKPLKLADICWVNIMFG
jgi:hypothetical protein